MTGLLPGCSAFVTERGYTSNMNGFFKKISEGEGLLKFQLAAISVAALTVWVVSLWLA